MDLVLPSRSRLAVPLPVGGLGSNLFESAGNHNCDPGPATFLNSLCWHRPPWQPNLRPCGYKETTDHRSDNRVYLGKGTGSGQLFGEQRFAHMLKCGCALMMTVEERLGIRSGVGSG